MKRILCLMLFALFLLSSCAESRDTEPVRLGFSLPAYQIKRPAEWETGDIPGEYASGLEEYYQLTDALSLPKEFIPYNALTDFGSFVSLFYNEFATHVYYGYVMRDEDGYGVGVTVNYDWEREPGKPLPTVIPEEELNDDLRTLPSGKTGRLDYLGMECYYVEGNLRHLAFYAYGRKISVLPDKVSGENKARTDFSGYPLANDSLLARLLSKETAPAAMAEFSADIEPYLKTIA